MERGASRNTFRSDANNHNNSNSNNHNPLGWLELASLASVHASASLHSFIGCKQMERAPCTTFGCATQSKSFPKETLDDRVILVVVVVVVVGVETRMSGIR
jgi:hypothetical protein